MNECQFEPEFKYTDTDLQRQCIHSKIVNSQKEKILRLLDMEIEKMEESSKYLMNANPLLRVSKLDGAGSPIKALEEETNAASIDHKEQQSQKHCEGKEIDGHAILECFEALNQRFDEVYLQLDLIIEMVEIPQEETLEGKTPEEEILDEEVCGEAQTFEEACCRLQSELDATVQRNELLESKIKALQEQVSTLEMNANNPIQHNELLEIKMESLEERVAALEMANNTNLHETHSQMASDNSWAGRDDYSNLTWDCGAEEDEW